MSATVVSILAKIAASEAVQKAAKKLGIKAWKTAYERSKAREAARNAAKIVVIAVSLSTLCGCAYWDKAVIYGTEEIAKPDWAEQVQE